MKSLGSNIFITVLMSILTLTGTIAAQEENTPKPSRPPLTPPPDNLPLIHIVSCTPADEFIKLAAQTYATAHPDLRLRITRGNLSDAAAKLARNEVDMMLTVSATPARPANCAIELHKVYIAAVNPANAMENISLARLKKLHTRGIKKWDELGGPNLPIKLVGYNEDVAEGQLLNAMLAGKPAADKDFTPLNSGREIGAIVAIDSNAIGIFPYEYRSNGIKILKVEGQYPALDKPDGGKYPLMARYYLSAAAKLSPHARKFVEFLNSDEAEKIYLYLSMRHINANTNAVAKTGVKKNK